MGDCLRGGVGVEEDVSVLQVLWVGAGLEVFLEGVAAFEGGDGGGVDFGGLGGVGHGCGCEGLLMAVEFVVWGRSLE